MQLQKKKKNTTQHVHQVNNMTSGPMLDLFLAVSSALLLILEIYVVRGLHLLKSQCNRWILTVDVLENVELKFQIFNF